MICFSLADYKTVSKIGTKKARVTNPCDSQDIIWIPNLWNSACSDYDQVDHVAHEAPSTSTKEHALELARPPLLLSLLTIDEIGFLGLVV